MASPAAVEVIVQKTEADCAIAGLAMLLGKPYKDVSVAALKLCSRPHRAGLWTPEIVKVAKHLGATLKVTSPTTIEDDSTGLLIVRKKNGVSHIVLLFVGVVVDPASGLLYDLSTYLKTTRYHVRGFLTI